MTRVFRIGFALGAVMMSGIAQADLSIGDQRGNARAVMEAAGVLQDVPYLIEWHEFPNAAPVLEAINSNHLDAGMLGDASLTFAVAAGVKAKAIFASNYFGNALITNQTSLVVSVADLKGKKIGTVKGSTGHALALTALEGVGLTDKDVTFVFTTPAEATLALNNGAVDAVASWEPYVSFAVEQTQARILLDGQAHPALNYLAASDQAIDTKRDELLDFTRRLSSARQWGAEHPGPYAEVISKLLKLPLRVAQAKVKRESNAPFNDVSAITKRQQATIELYAKNGLIKQSFPASEIVDGTFLPKAVVAQSEAVKP
jgi:sulfonate transport system substrate-binding protein